MALTTTSLNSSSAASTPTPDLFACLPLEMIGEIFEKLPRRDLFHCSLTCKKLNQAFHKETLWKKLLQRDLAIDVPMKQAKNLYYNYANGVCHVTTLQDHDKDITCLLVHKNMLISGSTDGIIRFWDLEKREEIATLQGHTNQISCLAIYDNMLISGSTDGTIKLWNLTTREEIAMLQGHTDRITCLTIHDNMLISGSTDGTIKLWDLNTRKEIATLQSSVKEIRCLAIHGNMLISVSNINTIKLLNLDTHHEVTMPADYDNWNWNWIGCLSVHNNMLISGSNGGKLDLWDLEKRKKIANLGWHINQIACLAIHGNMLISGSRDNTIKLWDLNTRKEIATLWDTDNIISLAIYGNGLISGSNDGIIKFWDFSASYLEIFGQLAEEFSRCDYLAAFNSMTPDQKQAVYFKMLELKNKSKEAIADEDNFGRQLFHDAHASVKATANEKMRAVFGEFDRKILDLDVAMKRFSRMPFRARDLIYGKLWQIMESPNEKGFGRQVFHDEHPEINATPEQKAQAIRNYLANNKT